MNINFDIKALPGKLKQIVKKLYRYAIIIFVLSAVGIYGFLVFQISLASQNEPTDEAVAEKLNSVKRLKIDQASIDKIQQLQDQNVGVQSLFQEARDNPFQAE